MFSSLADPGRAKRYAWRGVALAAHISFVLVLFALRETPMFVQASSASRGNGARNVSLLYFAPGNDSNARPHTASKEDAKLRVAPKKQRPKVKSKPMEQPVHVAVDGNSGEKPERAGTPFGSLDYASMAGHDVRPAYPVVYPDPPVSRNDLQGDVVVEVTIDRQGIVTDAKLVMGIRDEIDRKILDTVQNWKFKPAMMDGRPIASKHDVRFHFPG